MRIGIDARELAGKPTGVGRYLSGLLREWTTEGASHGHQFLLYSPRPLGFRAPHSEVRVVPGGGGTLWEQRDLRGALNRDDADVLFSPAYSTPIFTGIPRVVALHDISFAAHPEWFGWREGLRRRVLAKQSATVAKTVVTISLFSKSEIVSRFGISPEKVAVIPPGIDAPAAGSAPAGAPDAAHILFVGSIFNRRHVPELIAAFTVLSRRHNDAWLHLVGDNRSHPYQDLSALIADSPARDRIQWHEYVSDSGLQDLYRQARAFVFLSEYEGLGLTPLEALAASIPSLLLDTAVARESCGPAALYVQLGSVDRIADEIERLVYNDKVRRSLLSEAPATLARYDWRTAARDTLRTLEAAI